MAIFGAWFVTLQSANLPLLARAPAAHCCCERREAQCPCAVCTHARENAAPERTLKTCGSSGEAAPAVAALEPSLPSPGAAVAAPLQRILPESPAQAPSGLVQLVPTPPPLGRA